MVRRLVKKSVKSAVALTAALVTWTGTAAAHPEVSPQLVNRYLSLIVVGDRVEFFVTLLYGALPAAEVRKGLDRNHDGRLDDAEQTQGRQQWQRRAGELATVRLDGTPLPLGEAGADLQLGPDTSAGPAPLVVELYGSRPLPDGTHELRIEPGWDPPRLGETELVIDLAAGWELVSSRRAGGPPEQLTRYRLDGPGAGDRSATFVIRSTGPTAHRGPIVAVAAVIGTLAAVGLVLELARRRRKSPQCSMNG
jgi:hypothetical protein